MIIKYRTTIWRTAEIVTITAEKETPHYLWIKGRKYNQSSSSDKFHNSWDEAKLYLLSEGVRAVKDCEAKLDSAKDKLSKIRELEKI